MSEYYNNPNLLRIYEEWGEQQQKEFLGYCTGVKILYDCNSSAMQNYMCNVKQREQVHEKACFQRANCTYNFIVQTPDMNNLPAKIELLLSNNVYWGKL